MLFPLCITGVLLMQMKFQILEFGDSPSVLLVCNPTGSVDICGQDKSVVHTPGESLGQDPASALKHFRSPAVGWMGAAAM